MSLYLLLQWVGKQGQLSRSSVPGSTTTRAISEVEGTIPQRLGGCSKLLVYHSRWAEKARLLYLDNFYTACGVFGVTCWWRSDNIAGLSKQLTAQGTTSIRLLTSMIFDYRKHGNKQIRQGKDPENKPAAPRARGSSCSLLFFVSQRLLCRGLAGTRRSCFAC